MLYKDACACFLEVGGGDVLKEDDMTVQDFRDKSSRLIKAYEEVIRFGMFLQTIKSADAQMLQNEILNLQKASFYAILYRS